MRLVRDLVTCLRVLSRFPLPAATARETAPGAFADAAAMVSLAGVVIGLAPALVLLATSAAGLPPLLAAPLSIAALLAATGALHEDGLADCADGFGGGATLERKLAIMRDSRIGTYGACALALSLYLRAFALGTIATRSIWLAAATLVFAAALSRVMCLLPLILLPSARTDGLGVAAGKPASRCFAIAGGLAAIPAIAAMVAGASFGELILAVVAALAAALATAWIALRQIGGQTGDVLGAAQQLSELAVLLTIAGYTA